MGIFKNFKDEHFYFKLIAWCCCISTLSMFCFQYNSFWGRSGCIYSSAEASYNIILPVLLLKQLFGDKPSPYTGLVYSFIGAPALLLKGLLLFLHRKDSPESSIHIAASSCLLFASFCLLIDILLYFIRDKVHKQK